MPHAGSTIYAFDVKCFRITKYRNLREENIPITTKQKTSVQFHYLSTWDEQILHDKSGMVSDSPTYLNFQLNL